jgi:hypothetical protein
LNGSSAAIIDAVSHSPRKSCSAIAASSIPGDGVRTEFRSQGRDLSRGKAGELGPFVRRRLLHPDAHALDPFAGCVWRKLTLRIARVSPPYAAVVGMSSIRGSPWKPWALNAVKRRRAYPTALVLARSFRLLRRAPGEPAREATSIRFSS